MAESQDLFIGDDGDEQDFLDNEVDWYQGFKKTTELVPGTRYKVRYLRRVSSDFGVRIRAYLEGFNYDLPKNFLFKLNGYNLDYIDYSPVYMNYVGRKNDRMKTLILRLEGIPKQRPTTVPVTERVRLTNAAHTVRLRPSAIVLPRISQLDISSSNTSTTTTTTTTTTASMASSTIRSNSLGARRRPDLFNPRSAPLQPTPRISTTARRRCDNNNNNNLAQNVSVIAPDPPSTSASASTSASSWLNAELYASCGICLMSRKDAVLTPCGHRICRDCGKKFRRQPCPFCRKKVTSVVSTYD